jgi:[acyl-carrier-protein] S-malonyltransferase
MGQPWEGSPSWSLIGRLSEVTGRDLASLLLDADADTLRATRNAQLASFALSLVILDAARAEHLRSVPIAAYAGHSLGEYTALVAAGALDADAGALLVRERGEAMQDAADAQPGTMAAVLGLEPDIVGKACDDVEGAWVANDNAPGQVVIAGTTAGVSAAGNAAKTLGAKRVIGLPVGGAFHSPLMSRAQTRLDGALDRTEFTTANAPVVANVDAASHSTGWAELLSAQLCSPVRWRESLLTLAGRGVTHFCELGPGTELSGMVKRTLESARRSHVATPDDLAELADLAG